ncbi:hypothetical protein CCACVL1_21704, partial [Corchorus capsularis]
MASRKTCQLVSRSCSSKGNFFSSSQIW